MKYVYTLGYSINEHGASYSFVSSASFVQAADVAIRKIRGQHPSDKIEVRFFRCQPGDEVPDNFEVEDDYER